MHNRLSNKDRFCGDTKRDEMTENKYIPKPAKILEYHRESPDNYSIILDIKIKHDPGQFVQISVPGIGESPISICSYSGENLKLNIREVGNVTKAIGKMKKNDIVFVRGPYGRGYPMQSLKGNDLVIIGGGCGVAPLKGIIEYIEHHRKDYKDVFLFFGFRSPNDVLFKREMEKWKINYNLNMSVDQLPQGTCFDGRVDFITKLIEEAKLTNDNKVVFLCGPPKMMDITTSILSKKGFNDDQIFVSAERMMYCAMGACCHCMIHEKYCCTDGPVFRYDELKGYKND